MSGCGGKVGDLIRSQSILSACRDSEDFGFFRTQPVLLPALSAPHLCDKNPNPTNRKMPRTKNIMHNMTDSRLCVVRRVRPPVSSYYALTATAARG